MGDSVRINPWQIAGMAFCFAWVFLAHPPVDANAGIQIGPQSPIASLIRFATVGVVFYIAYPLLGKYLFDRSRQAISSAAFLAMRLLGYGIGLMSLSGAEPDVLLLFVGNLLTGGGVAGFLILWGLILASQDEEQGEMSFAFTFIAGGILMAILGLVPDSVLAVSLFFLPVLEFVCFLSLGKKQVGFEGNKAKQGGFPFSNSTEEGREFILVMARTFLSISLVSFVWEMFSASAQGVEFAKLSLFGIGLIVAAVVIFLFTRYSSSVGFVATARWVLPIMAIGLFFAAWGGMPSLAIACLLLAAAHSSFETILRMQIIDFARKHGFGPVYIVGWGFAAIALGSFVGPAFFHILFPGGSGVNRMHIVGILTFMVVISAFLFTGQMPSRSEEEKSDDISSRCMRMAERFGLSARETEVLGYLLEGRSHPYIRDELFISKSTVDTHVRHIYAKVGVNSKQDLIDASKE